MCLHPKTFVPENCTCGVTHFLLKFENKQRMNKENLRSIEFSKSLSSIEFRNILLSIYQVLSLIVILSDSFFFRKVAQFIHIVGGLSINITHTYTHIRITNCVKHISIAYSSLDLYQEDIVKVHEATHGVMHA